MVRKPRYARMFNALGWLIKAAFFTGLVLIASHMITWNGRTVSDQVRSGLSSAEHVLPGHSTLKTVKKKSNELVDDAREAASRIGVQGSKSPGAEKIKSKDRTELQAIIHSSDDV